MPPAPPPHPADTVRRPPVTPAPAASRAERRPVPEAPARLPPSPLVLPQEHSLPPTSGFGDLPRPPGLVGQ